MDEILLYFSIKYNGDWYKINKALENFEKVSSEDVEKIKKNNESNYITILDKKYPKKLKNSLRPPFVLFYKGNAKLLKKQKNKLNRKILWPFVTIDKTFDDTKSFEGFKKIQYVIGSSHPFETKFLENVNSRKIIVVKDSGINSNIGLELNVENKILKNKGLIISEYPNHVISSPKQWIETSKIKSSLSNKVLILNSSKTKELFEILFYIINQKNSIFCLKNIKEKDNYNNYLIKNGAYGINNIKEIDEIWQKI